MAALRASGLYEEQKQPDAAARLVDRALELNPLNLAALREKAELAGAGMDAVQRLRLTLDMLRASPAQTDLILYVAQMVADAGLVEESVRWYTAAQFSENRRG